MRHQCTDPDCDRPAARGGLCEGHHARRRDGSNRTGPINTAEVLTDEFHVPCPNELLPVAGACADLDAKAIVRLIWPHLLEANLAGLEPFTLEQMS